MKAARQVMILVVLCLVTASTRGAVQGLPKATTPLAQCPYTSDAITVDGNMDEQAWQNASLLAPFQLLSDKGYPENPTEVKVLHNDEFLFVAFVCHESQMDKFAPNCKERDGTLWISDVLEIFLNPSGNQGYFQLALNVEGVQTDFRNSDRAWNGKWTCAVKRFADRWTVEVAIPFSDIGFSPASGESLGFNVARTRKRGRIYNSVWSQTGDAFKNISKLGELTFVRSANLVWKVIGLEKGTTDEVTLEVSATPAGHNREYDVTLTAYSGSKPVTADTHRIMTQADFSEGAQKVTLPIRFSACKEPAGLQVVLRDRDGNLISRSGRLPVELLMQNEMIWKELSRKYEKLVSQGVPKRLAGRVGRWKEWLDHLKDHPDDRKVMESLSHELAFATLAKELPASTQNADVLPYALPVFSVVTEFHVPQRGDLLDKALQVVACRGESEPTSLHLLAMTDLRSVTLKVEDLVAGEKVLSAGAVNTFLLKNWYQSGKLLGVTSQAYLVPELLLKDDGLITVDHERQRNELNFDPVYGPDLSDTLQPVAIKEGTNRQFWLRVDVPKDQPAGKYCGQVVVKNDGKEIARVPLEVTVLPVTLENSEATFGAYSNYEYRPGAEKWKHARSGPYYRVNETFYRNLLKMCARYGMNSLMMQEGIILGDIPGGPAPPSTEYVRKAFELRKQYGLTKKTPYNGFHWSSTPAAGVRIWETPASVVSQATHSDVKGFAAGLGELKRIYDDFEKDIPEFYVYTVDEPQNRPEFLIPQAKAINSMVHAVGLKTAEATAEPLDSLDLLLEAGAGLAKKRKNQAKDTLIYWHPREEPLYNRKFTGLIVWYAGYGGTYPYVLANFGKHGWDDFHVPAGKGFRPIRLIYDGRDTPVATIQMEAYREGVDDYKYMEMIERRCNELKKIELNADEQKTLDAAVTLINNLPSWFNDEQAESYQKLRSRSQDVLVQLESIVQGKR